MSSSAAADTAPQTVTHEQMANAIRALAMDAVQKANSGHPGMPMGTADMATVLYSQFLKFDPQSPLWPDRDRFILSAGHGSMLLYALGFLTGFEKMELDEIRNFRQMGHITPGHPEVMPEVGIETTTGPLGQGISMAVGFALAERIMNARFGDDLVDHYTYVIAGDGDLQEGISHEACSLAGHLQLNKLVVMYDSNHISIDGPTDLSYSENTVERFKGYGWDVMEVDGHNPAEIRTALEQAKKMDQPTLVICTTKIGFGAPNKEGSSSSHGSPLGDEEIAGARKNLDWPYAPFEIPQDILEAWREVGGRGAQDRAEWQKRYDATDASTRKAFDKAIAGDVSGEIEDLILQIKKDFVAEKPKLATRQTSGKVLDVLVPAVDELMGGSADLTGSNNTLVKGHDKALTAGDFSGRYIHYGVREHGMAAAMNGMALHGGVIPYSGTFLVFTDYCRPSIRLSALMKQRVVYVMTHDSIGLGEDGPTHQPVEHVAALRSMPNLQVFRPCDGVETAECWQLALNKQNGPTVLALTRQGLPTVREDATTENKSARGAYTLREADGDAKVVIIATGSEIELAMAARDTLQEKGVPTRVVSMPSMELFEAQDADYKQSVLGTDTIKVGVEAAVRLGWDRYIGPDGIFIGMNSFGESAPYQELYKHFGITAEAIVAAVEEKL